jgi:hypothetical protein
VSLLYEVSRVVDLPGGGNATVTVRSEEPIDEAAYLILRPQAAREMSNCLVSIANALRPPLCPEIRLAPRIDAAEGNQG